MDRASKEEERKGRHLYIIPFQDRFILYRPLQPLAFVADRAVNDLALSFADLETVASGKNNDEARRFLKAVGVDDPDFPMPEGAGRTPFKPTIVVLFTTAACNVRCIDCYASGGENETIGLPFETRRRSPFNTFVIW